MNNRGMWLNPMTILLVSKKFLFKLGAVCINLLILKKEMFPRCTLSDCLKTWLNLANVFEVIISPASPPISLSPASQISYKKQHY